MIEKLSACLVNNTPDLPPGLLALQAILRRAPGAETTA